MKKSFSSVLLTVFFLLPVYAGAADGGIDSLRESSKAFAHVAESTSPSVALLRVEGSAQPQATPSSRSPFDDDFLRRFFGGQLPPGAQPRQAPQSRRVVGQGSGFVFSVDDGLVKDTTYLLTNNHVVENADKITVTFPDGREFDAKVTGRDPKSDVAVVEIATADIPALRMADSSELVVGEWVVAIGNPFGLSHTLTVGVVSAKGRTGIGINDYEDFIQTDAAINPGNSGGPLVNLDGEVVGINTAIFSRSGGNMGIGFAIPSTLAKSIAEQLIENGSVTRGHLGIVIQPLTADLAESFDIEPGKGILVGQVSPDSPADKGGLEAGDIIVAYDGKPVSDIGAFRNRVAATKPGARQKLTVLRDGKTLNLSVRIGQLDEDAQVASDDTASASDLGLTVQTLTADIAEELGVEAGKGVVVSNVVPGSVGAMAGLRRGTVILEVNRKSVASPRDFERAVDAAGSRNRILLLVSQNGTQRFVALSW